MLACRTVDIRKAVIFGAIICLRHVDVGHGYVILLIVSNIKCEVEGKDYLAPFDDDVDD